MKAPFLALFKYMIIKKKEQQMIFIGAVFMLVFIFALAMTWWLFNNIELFKAASPIFITLVITTGFSAYKYFDQKKTEVIKEFEKNMFEISVNSQFSITITEKRTEFIQRYSACFEEILKHLWINADVNLEELGKLLNNLNTIKNQFRPWLSHNQYREVDELEREIRKFYADSHYLDSVINRGINNHGQNVTFENKLESTQKFLIKYTSDYIIDEIYERIRSILGITDISHLQEKMFEEARSYTKR